MTDERTFKVIELVGTSSKSLTDALDNAVDRASDTMDNLGWFEVVEQRGRIDGGEVDAYQVKVKVGFQLED